MRSETIHQDQLSLSTFRRMHTQSPWNFVETDPTQILGKSLGLVSTIEGRFKTRFSISQSHSCFPATPWVLFQPQKRSSGPPRGRSLDLSFSPPPMSQMQQDNLPLPPLSIPMSSLRLRIGSPQRGSSPSSSATNDSSPASSPHSPPAFASASGVDTGHYSDTGHR